ncbi:MAG: S8 family peptidase, partial [Flavobacteriales bacterium]
INKKVLIEIVVFNNQFNSVSTFLTTFGISPNDYISDVYNSADDERVITVFFPIADLQALNPRSDIINQVYEVSPPIPNKGLINSQGDAAQNSDIARLGWNVSGTGVNVGVISDSYDRKSGVQPTTTAAVLTDIANGDLPGVENPVTVVQDFPFGVSSDEGRAMMQIVHDVAPDAKLFFRTGFISEGNMAAGIAQLVNLNCDVIVDDLTYMKAPFYRDGIIAKAIDAATDSGVSYFSSAGNFGSRSYESNFIAAPSNPLRHNFGGNTFLQKLTLDVGQYVIALQWDDDFYSLGSPTGAVNDMDIYLASDTGVLQYGFNRNNLGADPIEIIPFTVLNPTTTNIIIERAVGNGAPLKFKYVVFRAGNDGNFQAIPAANGSTIVGHANADGAIAVGAVRYDNTPAFPAFTGVITAQQSSSLGGTTTQGILRSKPDLMAPTGGDTSVNLGAPDYEGNSLPNFFGTSASAPHAAGIAALIIDAKTKFGVDTVTTNRIDSLAVRNILKNTAIDMETLGFDFKTGSGFVSADGALAYFSNPSPNLLRF